ncbi:MAG: amidohydrolase family protein [Bacteroidales bacterium]|nr:amidohydrolase family protein [Bacteroidales bacterium]
MKKISFILICIFVSSFIYAQKATRLPVFDVHVHVMKINPNMPSAPLCPWFLSDMPGADPNDNLENAYAFMNGDCLDPWMPAKNDEELKDEIVKRIIEKNITMVAFGDPGVMRSWMKEVPEGRIIPGISPDNLTVEQFRDSLESGFYKVMAEVAPQYEGMSPSDMSLDPYFAVAEELNIPAGIHMGTGGNGMINITSDKYRASLGDPFLLEDLLARHPKLKIYVMHAGYPLLEHMIALMGANAYVYVDISGMIWSYPLDHVHTYIKGLVQAGFGKRIMYGTDFFTYPRMIEGSMSVIENARYLGDDQKRDILFNNAARFFRMDESRFDWPQ